MAKFTIVIVSPRVMTFPEFVWVLTTSGPGFPIPVAVMSINCVGAVGFTSAPQVAVPLRVAVAVGMVPEYEKTGRLVATLVVIPVSLFTNIEKLVFHWAIRSARYAASENDAVVGIVP